MQALKSGNKNTQATTGTAKNSVNFHTSLRAPTVVCGA